MQFLIDTNNLILLLTLAHHILSRVFFCCCCFVRGGEEGGSEGGAGWGKEGKSSFQVRSESLTLIRSYRHTELRDGSLQGKSCSMPPAVPTHWQPGAALLLPAPGRRTGTAAGHPLATCLQDSAEMRQHAAWGTGLRKRSSSGQQSKPRARGERGFKSLCPSGKDRHPIARPQQSCLEAASSLGTVQPVGLLAASVTLPPILHPLLLPSLSSAPASLLLIIPCPVALGGQEAARSSFSVPPVHPQADGEEEKALASLGQLQAQLPGSGGKRAWKRRRGHCLSQPVLWFSRASVQNPCSAGSQKRTGLIITLSLKAN